MRRAQPGQTKPRPEEPLARLGALMADGLALRLLLAHLPAGATPDDARRLRERILQSGRQPSRLLDEALGIERA